MDEERHLIVKDMPKPQEKDENIIIKVEAASICGTDMRTFLKGNAKIDPPRILGHECAGTIIHAGSLAKEHGYHEGERVTVAQLSAADSARHVKRDIRICAIT